MTCAKAREYIFAFLDNELDAALSLEMQQHIEHCPFCARECEIESAVRKQLAEKLHQREEACSPDESALVRVLRSKSTGVALGRSNPSRSWKQMIGPAVAAAVLLAILLVVVDRARNSAHPTFVDALVNDLDHFATEGKTLEFVSADATAVSDWLSGRTALAIRIPAVDADTGTLLGGRKCKINGVPAAFAMYRVGDEIVSVVALRGSDEALSHMKRVDRNGHTHWVDHCRDHTVLACRRGGLIYAIVSRLSEDALSPLMPSTKG